MARTIQRKFRTITENNEEIQKMKLLNKKISPEEEKKLAEDLSQLLVQNSGFSDAIGKSLEIMKEDVEKSKEEAENPNASDTMYRLKDNVFTYLTKFF